MAKVVTRKKRNAQYGFYDVEVPLTSASVSLYGHSVEDVEGRIIKLDLSKMMRGKSFELKMKVKADGEKLTAEPISAVILNTYIKRVMRKGVDYVEDSFEAKCKDGTVIVKPFLITRKKVSRAVRLELRKTARDFLTGLITPKTKIELFQDIMANKVQKEMALKLKKVYPLALSEVRVFKIKPEVKKSE